MNPGGTGKEVLELLETIAKKNDISILIGIIARENNSSIGLLEKSGYEKCAHFKEVGEKPIRLSTNLV